MTNNRYIGSSFDDFLAEEGILEDCTQFATDKVLEWQESNKNKVLQNSDCEREGDHSKSMAIGEILWFGGHKDGQKNNYGFIFYTEIDKNKIYVDRNQVPQHLQELFEGDREKGKGIVVEFEIGNNHKGPCAVNVRLHQKIGIVIRQRSSLRLEIYKAYIECEDKSQVYVEDHSLINNGDIVSFAIKNNRRQSAIEVVKIDPNTIDKETIKNFVYSSNFNLSNPFIESYISALSEAEAIHFILEKIKFVSNNDEALKLLKKVSENLFLISRELRDVLFNFNFQEYVDFIKKNLDYEDESIRQILWTEFLEYLNSPDYKIFEPFLWLYISKVEIQHSITLTCNKIRSIPLDKLDSFIKKLLSLSKLLFLFSFLYSEDLRNLLKEHNLNQYAESIQEILDFDYKVEDLRILREKSWTDLLETISNCSNKDRDTLWKKITYLEIGLEYHNYLWNFAPISSKKKIIEARYSVFFSLVNEFKDSGYVGVDGISMNYRDLYQFNINDKTLASLWAGSNASKDVSPKMLSARGAEKLVQRFYKNLGNNVEDIAIYQVTDKKNELWKQADIRVSSNKSQKLLDVKNTRQPYKSKVYSEVCVRKFKEIQGEDVIIAAVLSPNIQLKYMDGSDTPDFHADSPIYLGELSYKRLQSLTGIFSDKGIKLDMTRGFEPESYLPPWLFDYDEQFYQNQISISDKLKTLQDSEIPSYDDFKILNEGSIEAYIPLFIFANKPIPETWRQQIPQWKITLIELLYRQDNSCLTLSHVYMSILKHFLIMLFSGDINYDPTNIMNLLGDKTHPLKIYDPRGIIKDFCDTLAKLWNKRKEVDLNGFNIFKFSGRGLLEGKREGETSYTKLLAYCGGQIGKIGEDVRCGYSPLIIGKDKICLKCHYLICPQSNCGHCKVDLKGNSVCSDYERRRNQQRNQNYYGIYL